MASCTGHLPKMAEAKLPAGMKIGDGCGLLAGIATIASATRGFRFLEGAKGKRPLDYANLM